MSKSKALADALQSFEDTRASLRRLAQNRPENWIKEYATVRAGLQRQLSELAEKATGWFHELGDTDGKDRFLELIKAAKSRMEQHQARWPVLMIEKNVAGYVSSMAEVEARWNELGKFLRSRIKL